MMVNDASSPSMAPEKNRVRESQVWQAGTDPNGGNLVEGARIGRFVIVRDVDGRTHAIAAGAVGAICQTDDGALLLLAGGRLVHVPRPMATLLAWLDGRTA